MPTKPDFPNMPAMRRAALAASERYDVERAEVAAMRELGAPEPLCARLQRDLRAARLTTLAYYRAQHRAILEDKYPRPARKPRVTTVPLRVQFPDVYRKRSQLIRGAKERLVDCRMTLEQYREYEQRLAAYIQAAYNAVAAGYPIPAAPPYPKA